MVMDHTEETIYLVGQHSQPSLWSESVLECSVKITGWLRNHTKIHDLSALSSAVIAQILIDLFWFLMPKLWPYGSVSVHKNNLIIKFS